MTRIGLLLLDTLANVFLKATLIVKLCMCKHDISCALEKIVMTDLRESIWNLVLQPLKHHTSTTSMTIATKTRRVVNYHDGFPSINLYDPLIM